MIYNLPHVLNVCLRGDTFFFITVWIFICMHHSPSCPVIYSHIKSENLSQFVRIKGSTLFDDRKIFYLYFILLIDLPIIFQVKLDL